MKFYSYHKMDESVYLFDDKGKMVFPKDFAIKDEVVVDTYYRRMSKEAPKGGDESQKVFMPTRGFPHRDNQPMVGRGTPEFTPAETPLAGYLQREGISYASLNQEPQPSWMRGCQTIVRMI